MRRLAALALLLVGCHAVGDGRGTLGVFGDRDPRVLYSLETDVPLVALTIDDAPDPESTDRLLSVLDAHEARATFFVISSRVPGNEAALDAIVAGGHEVANHHARDVPSIELSPEEFERELLGAQATLARWAPSRWFRPASGWYHDWMLDLLDLHGFRCALGSVYPLDAQIPLVGLAAWWVARGARPGSIIILHDGGGRGDRSAQVLDRVLPKLRARGIGAGTLSELVRRASPGDLPARPRAADSVGKPKASTGRWG